MKLKEIREWIDSLPKDFMEFEVVNGVEGLIDDEYYYRLDKPIVSLTVDEENEEIVFLNDKDKKNIKDENSND